jgi:hypothetical protein
MKSNTTHELMATNAVTRHGRATYNQHNPTNDSDTLTVMVLVHPTTTALIMSDAHLATSDVLKCPFSMLALQSVKAAELQ